MESRELMQHFHRSTFGSDEVFLTKFLYPRLEPENISQDFRFSKLFVMNQKGRKSKI